MKTKEGFIWFTLTFMAVAMAMQAFITFSHTMKHNRDLEAQRYIDSLQNEYIYKLAESQHKLDSNLRVQKYFEGSNIPPKNY